MVLSYVFQAKKKSGEFFAGPNSYRTYTYGPWHRSTCFAVKSSPTSCTHQQPQVLTVDGRNPAPPGMYKTTYQLVQDFSVNTNKRKTTTKKTCDNHGQMMFFSGFVSCLFKSCDNMQPLKEQESFQSQFQQCLVGGFQPIWKICSSNWIILKGIQVRIFQKNLWNNHLDLVILLSTWPHWICNPPTPDIF